MPGPRDFSGSASYLFQDTKREGFSETSCQTRFGSCVLHGDAKRCGSKSGSSDVRLRQRDGARWVSSGAAWIHMRTAMSLYRTGPQLYRLRLEQLPELRVCVFLDQGRRLDAESHFDDGSPGNAGNPEQVIVAGPT
jgi:hypothetical protein